MEATDFGKIALLVNESGNLKHGEVQIYNSGQLVIQYTEMIQTIAPCDLNILLIVKQNEYQEELAPLVAARDEADAPSWRERNLKSYIGDLVTVGYLLERLTTFQKEKEKGDSDGSA